MKRKEPRLCPTCLPKRKSPSKYRHGFCYWHFQQLPERYRTGITTALQRQNLPEYARLKGEAMKLLREMFG